MYVSAYVSYLIANVCCHCCHLTHLCPSPGQGSPLWCEQSSTPQPHIQQCTAVLSCLCMTKMAALWSIHLITHGCLPQV